MQPLGRQPLPSVSLGPVRVRVRGLRVLAGVWGPARRGFPAHPSRLPWGPFQRGILALGSRRVPRRGSGFISSGLGRRASPEGWALALHVTDPCPTHSPPAPLLVPGAQQAWSRSTEPEVPEHRAEQHRITHTYTKPRSEARTTPKPLACPHTPLSPSASSRSLEFKVQFFSSRFSEHFPRAAESLWPSGTPLHQLLCPCLTPG